MKFSQRLGITPLEKIIQNVGHHGGKMCAPHPHATNWGTHCKNVKVQNTGTVLLYAKCKYMEGMYVCIYMTYMNVLLLLH